MNRWIIAMAGVLVLSLTGTGAAAEKIGFVDVREIMLNSDAGKKATEEFKKLVEKNRLLIQGSETELQKMKDEIEKQRTVLTEKALKEKETAFQKKFRDYQVLGKEANEDLQAKEQEIYKNMLPEIHKVINSVAEKEKYTVIFDLSAM
ncbi:MAG: OmpH family outer membrane protein, partial [Syntrophales bacterium]|nr:OmpH family outer membrane protein [Syntrophales bacterium]